MRLVREYGEEEGPSIWEGVMGCHTSLRQPPWCTFSKPKGATSGRFSTSVTVTTKWQSSSSSKPLRSLRPKWSSANSSSYIRARYDPAVTHNLIAEMLTWMRSSTSAHRGKADMVRTCQYVG